MSLHYIEILAKLLPMEIVIQPFRRLKTLNQAQSVTPKDTTALAGYNLSAKIYKNRGLRGFWTGFLPRLLNTLTRVLTREVLDRVLIKMYDPYSFFWKHRWLSTLVGRFLGSLICYPFLNISLKQESESPEKRKYSNSVQFVKEQFKSGGISRFYTGFLWTIPTAIGTALFDEVLPLKYQNRTTFVLYEFLTYPLQMIKTRMIAQAGEENPEYENGKDCCKKIWREKKIIGFWEGALTEIILLLLMTEAGKRMHAQVRKIDMRRTI